MATQLVRAEIVALLPSGHIRVRYHGKECDALPVRSARIEPSDVGLSAVLLDDGTEAPPLLLSVVDAPIGSSLRDILLASEAKQEVPRSPIQISSDGETVIIEAKKDVIIRTGESQIRLSNDGRIISRANEIVSHARRTNKVRGAAVKLN